MSNSVITPGTTAGTTPGTTRKEEPASLHAPLYHEVPTAGSTRPAEMHPARTTPKDSTHKNLRIPNVLIEKLKEECAVYNIDFTTAVVNRLFRVDLLTRELAEQKRNYEHALRKLQEHTLQLEDQVKLLDDDLGRGATDQKATREAMEQLTSDNRLQKTQVEYLKTKLADAEVTNAVMGELEQKLATTSANNACLKAENGALCKALLSSSPFTESDLDELKKKATEALKSRMKGGSQ